MLPWYLHDLLAPALLRTSSRVAARTNSCLPRLIHMYLPQVHTNLDIGFVIQVDEPSPLPPAANHSYRS